MDKSMAGVMGAVGVLALASPAHDAAAAPMTMEAAMQATSYADLLRPIPNAKALLVEAALEQPDVPPPGPPPHHHHHHHHRRRHHVPPPPPPPPPHHHHHHHHNQQAWAGGPTRRA
jgi:hypothetical protein